MSDGFVDTFTKWLGIATVLTIGTMVAFGFVMSIAVIGMEIGAFAAIVYAIIGMALIGTAIESWDE